MADYKKMYAVLCGAVDTVIEPLEQIPLALPAEEILHRALLDAEEIYIETTPVLEKVTTSECIVLKVNRKSEQQQKSKYQHS